MKKIALIFWICFWMMTGAAFAGNKTVLVQWDYATPPSDMAGFQIYFSSTAFPTDCKTVPATQMVDVPYTAGMVYSKEVVIASPDGQRVQWRFKMTAYDTSANVSACSTEATTFIDFEAPGAPTNPRVTVKITP